MTIKTYGKPWWNRPPRCKICRKRHAAVNDPAACAVLTEP